MNGCICNAGWKGPIIATTVSPFTSSCLPVSCPAGSHGSTGTVGSVVARGCTCDSVVGNRLGFVTATSQLPYYISNCTILQDIVGGVVTTDNGFRIHTFTSTGNCDSLLII